MKSIQFQTSIEIEIFEIVSNFFFELFVYHYPNIKSIT